MPLVSKPSPAGPLKAKALCFGGYEGDGRWVWGRVGDGNSHRVTHDRESMEVNVRL